MDFLSYCDIFNCSVTPRSRPALVSIQLQQLREYASNGFGELIAFFQRHHRRRFDRLPQGVKELG
jgi:hypothetical protein